MSHKCFSMPLVRLLLFCCVLSLFLSGCRSSSKKTEAAADLPLRDSTPQVPDIVSDESCVYETDTLLLDASNCSQGYFLLTYLGTNEKVKLQLQAPDGITYTYLVTDCTSACVFPLTGGDGSYQVSLLESVDAKKNRYAVTYTESLEVTLENEFLPFLTPNIYVSYTAQSSCVEKAQELSLSCHSDLEVITQIYHYVTEHISYDKQKAQSVSYGYLPQPDETLETGKGICFDYAALTSAMLRSQRIPTRLEVGYAGEVYHAWISCYVEEIGWVDNIIEFHGDTWSLIDPTLAAGNSRDAVEAYIGDGSSYLVKYTY